TPLKSAPAGLVPLAHSVTFHDSPREAGSTWNGTEWVAGASPAKTKILLANAASAAGRAPGSTAAPPPAHRRGRDARGASAGRKPPVSPRRSRPARHPARRERHSSSSPLRRGQV